MEVTLKVPSEHLIVAVCVFVVGVKQFPVASRTWPFTEQLNCVETVVSGVQLVDWVAVQIGRDLLLTHTPPIETSFALQTAAVTVAFVPPWFSQES